MHPDLNPGVKLASGVSLQNLTSPELIWQGQMVDEKLVDERVVDGKLGTTFATIVPLA